jgi:hypothetical protein
MPVVVAHIERRGVLVEARRCLVPEVTGGAVFWPRPEAIEHVVGQVIGDG